MYINKIFFKILSQIHFFSWVVCCFGCFPSLLLCMERTLIFQDDKSPVFNLEFLYIQILHLNVNASGIKSTCKGHIEMT